MTVILLIAVTQMVFATGAARACKYVPINWQRVVDRNADAAFVGQRKHTTWLRDRNRNFIDDIIDRRFHKGDTVDVVVELNACQTVREIEDTLSKFGHVAYMGKLVGFVALDGVAVEALPELARLPQVAMIEWSAPLRVTNDVSSRAVQANRNSTYGSSAAAMGFDGTGINIAIIDTGVDDAHEALTGKFVAGFDAFSGVGGAGTNPDDQNGHGTHVAGIAMGRGTMGRICRHDTADTEPPDCAGVASAAGLVDVMVCGVAGSCDWAEVSSGLDWVGINANVFNIRVANFSMVVTDVPLDGGGTLGCAAGEGKDALSELVNYVAALGITVVAAQGNASKCSLPNGTVRTPSPAAASYAITVAATDDRGTVIRNPLAPDLPDIAWSGGMTGPRVDFAATHNPLALKPDISAPGTGIVAAQFNSTDQYVAATGTSQATAQVSGAAALVIQQLPQINPGSVKLRLASNADFSRNSAAFPAEDPHWDVALGHGMLNVAAALGASQLDDPAFTNCSGAAPGMPGTPCPLSNGQPAWNNSADISLNGLPPTVDVPNAINARISNTGSQPVTVQVNFGIHVFGTGTNRFEDVGTQTVSVAPGPPMIVTQAWTPNTSGHQCTQVTINYGQDANYNNNVTQLNLNVAPSVSPAVFAMQVENPFMTPARFDIETKVATEGWTCRVSEPKFQLDAFFYRPRRLEVTLEPPAGAPKGATADCDVGVYAVSEDSGGQRLIGGVTVRGYVP